MATAERTGARVILANDPDADRLAVAIKDDTDGWRILSGNEIGTHPIPPGRGHHLDDIP